METYYKVVRVVKHGRSEIKTSLFADYLPAKLHLVYKYNRWVHADPVLLDQGFGICVFNNYDDADYLYQDVDVEKPEIWECKITPMKNPKSRRCELLKEYIDYNNIDKTAILFWPKGTVLAESIKLTKRM